MSDPDNEMLHAELSELQSDNERLSIALEELQKDVPQEEIDNVMQATKFLNALCAQLARYKMLLGLNKEALDRCQDDLVKAYTVITSTREAGLKVLDAEGYNEHQTTITDLRDVIEALPEKDDIERGL